MSGSLVTDNSQDVRIAQIRKYVTIFEVLRTMGHEYEEATQQIKCPFHEDRSPSARVYADQNKVYCFTEQKSWDVIDAAQEILKGSLPDALTWLEQEFSVPGVTKTLQGTIRTQLATRLVPDIRDSAAMVEARLKAARRALGFEKYTKLLFALDLSVWEVSEKKLTPMAFSERMAQLLGLLR